MQAVPGKRYRHYKGKEYTVLHIAFNSETLEEEVVYQAEYNTEQFGDRPIWVRSKDMFEEQITIDDTAVDRFTRIN